MTEEWITYPCQIGDGPASVFFDHGARERFPRPGVAAAENRPPPAPTTLAQIDVAMRTPLDNGLSSSEESEALFAFEDDLEAIVQRLGAVTAGRITHAGRRCFYVYAAADEATWRAHLQALGARHGYAADLELAPDPEYGAYWRMLYPSPYDWQVIADLRTLEQFRNRGDDLATERRIEHWAYFPNATSAEAFRAAREAEGYETSPLEAPQGEPPRVAVRFAHYGSLQLSDLTAHTTTLQAAAAEAGGDYDGWEAPVCASPPSV
jgi:hypothetical protein